MPYALVDLISYYVSALFAREGWQLYFSAVDELALTLTSPAKQALIVNPESPNIAMSIAKGIKATQEHGNKKTTIQNIG